MAPRTQQWTYLQQYTTSSPTHTPPATRTKKNICYTYYKKWKNTKSGTNIKVGTYVQTTKNTKITLCQSFFPPLAFFFETQIQDTIGRHVHQVIGVTEFHSFLFGRKEPGSRSWSHVTTSGHDFKVEFHVELSKVNRLVDSTLLKNISQIGNLPQIGVNMKNIWNHHLVKVSKPFIIVCVKRNE